MTEKKFNPIPLQTLIPGMAESPFGRDDLLHTSYRPTIVIGLGGTGLAIVRRLKKLIRRYYRGEEMDIFQFIVFDTAAQEVPEGEEPLDAGEFVHLGAFDAADLIRHLNENPYISSWWPGSTVRPYRPTFSGTGANRVRAVGRLVLHSYLSSVVLPRLEAKFDRAIAINAQHGMGATSIKVYIISSLAGGTGSGMVIDLAYLARMLGLRRQPTTYVTGLLVLDDAFLPKAHTEYTRAEFRANTYQALKEINYFSKVRSFKEQYDDVTSTLELPDGFRPFDIAYLLGLHNAEGQALESFESLADMVAAEVMTEIASPLHGRTENVLDNIRANDRTIAGQPAAYSSFAVSAIVFPMRGIASWCALKSYAAFVRSVLLSSRQPVFEVETEVIGFMQKAGIEQQQANHLLDNLNQDDQSAPLISPALNHDQIHGLPEIQLMGTLQRIEEKALADLTGVRDQISQRIKPLNKHYEATLNQQVHEYLKNPQYGPLYLSWFLRRLVERVKEQRDQMVNDQSAFRAEMDAREAAWRAAIANISQVLRLPGWLPFRSGQLQNARSAYTAAFNAYLSAAHQLELRTQAVLCLGEFNQAVQILSGKLDGMIAAWQRLAESSVERAQSASSQEQATETEYSLMHNIVAQQELEEIYGRLLPDFQEETIQVYHAGQFWRFIEERLPDWSLHSVVAETDENNPTIQTYNYLAEWYAAQMVNRSLLEIMKEVYQNDWQREIELRYRQTSPFWNFNLSRFGDKIRNNLQHEPRLVGYGEDNVAVWTQEVSRSTGETVDGVNNKNPHEMVFLNTSHGLPLFALRSINQTMKTSHTYLQRLWQQTEPGSNPIPVFISTRWEADLAADDILPVTSNEPEKSEEPPVLHASGPQGLTSPAEDSGNHKNS